LPSACVTIGVQGKADDDWSDVDPGITTSQAVRK